VLDPISKSSSNLDNHPCEGRFPLLAAFFIIILQNLKLLVAMPLSDSNTSCLTFSLVDNSY